MRSMTKVWIYSPLGPDDAERVTRACNEGIAWWEAEGELWAGLGGDRDEAEEDQDRVHGGWSLPFLEELRGPGTYYAVQIPPAIRDRLLTCRSGFELEIANDGTMTRLAESAIRFLLERGGSGCVDWGHHRPVLGEEALGRVRAWLAIGSRAASAKLAAQAPDAALLRARQEELVAEVLSGLCQLGLLEVSDDFDPERAAQAFTSPGEGAADALLDWLVDQKDVIEVHAAADDVERLIRRLLGDG
jgi:hypothetical protein